MAHVKKNLAVLISGRGSNLQSLIDACADPVYPAHVALVVSNVPEAFGLQRARMAGIPAAVVPHRDFKSREDFETALLEILAPHAIDIVCLAGFMRILTPIFISRWPGRLINIHPSLLPDYKGLDTHARALADRKTEAGCTVHYVVPEMDSGPVIVQRRVPVLAGDTADSLATRVLEQEHIAYPEAVRIVVDSLK